MKARVALLALSLLFAVLPALPQRGGASVGGFRGHQVGFARQRASGSFPGISSFGVRPLHHPIVFVPGSTVHRHFHHGFGFTFGFPVFGFGFDTPHFVILGRHPWLLFRHPLLHHHFFFGRPFVSPFFLPFASVSGPIVLVVPQVVPIQVPPTVPLEAAGAPEQSVVSTRETESAWLGIFIAEVTREKAQELKLPAARGVLVTEVEPDSPAAKAGLKANDVITEFNEQRVEGTLQFRRLVRETPVGHTVQLTFWRNGQAKTISVEFTSRRAEIEKRMLRPRGAETDIHLGWRSPLLGISGEDISGQLGTYFGVPGGEGVLIREVKPGSPADKVGLIAGDVLTKVNGEQVRSVSALQDKLRDQKTFSLTVIRKGAQISANIEIE